MQFFHIVSRGSPKLLCSLVGSVLAVFEDDCLPDPEESSGHTLAIVSFQELIGQARLMILSTQPLRMAGGMPHQFDELLLSLQLMQSPGSAFGL